MANGTKDGGYNARIKDWCNLLNGHGIVNNMHISISKPNIPFVKYLFYHKISLTMQLWHM